MSNIEIIEDFILELKSFELNKDTLEIANELESLLAERKQDKKRIQELEKDKIRDSCLAVKNKKGG